jgi:hypothetical protein
VIFFGFLSNLILPHGLEQPRIMIELTVNIHSANVLLKYRINNYEKVKNQLNNLKKNFIGSSSNPRQVDDDDNDDNDEEDAKSASDSFNYTMIALDDQQASKEDASLLNKMNLFVRITFLGVTVRPIFIGQIKGPYKSQQLSPPPFVVVLEANSNNKVNK